jgi:hypothetical protein
MRNVLFASVAAILPVAFTAEVLETVMAKVKGGSGDYVRVNKADVGANPDNYTVSNPQTEKQEPVTPPGVVTNVAPGLEIPPAPSAPDFRAPEPLPGAPAAPALGAPVAPTVPSPDQKLVTKDGAKFFVVRPDGTRIDDVEGIDPKGYKDEKAAWAAIMALPH